MEPEKKRIEDEVRRKCKNKNLSLKGYFCSPEKNLISQFENWEEIKDEIGKGKGGELKATEKDLPKFNAWHSSSALCVNNFAPFKQNKDNFKFFNLLDFKVATFEKELKTGISKPNLDFCLSNDNVIIGIESKFLEIIDPKKPDHIMQKKEIGNLTNYLNRIQELKIKERVEIEEIIKSYISHDNMYLDISQLIKHTIGLLNTNHSQKVLVYIYWLPINWQEFEIYNTHHLEIVEFKNRIHKLNDSIEFHSISYLDFWNLFEDDQLFSDHIRRVKERYKLVV